MAWIGEIKGLRIRTIVLALFAIALSAWTISTPTKRAPDKTTFVPNEYLVQIESRFLDETWIELERRLDAKILSEVTKDILLVEKMNLSQKDAVRDLKNTGVVKIVEPNAIYRVARLANDPRFSTLWGLKNIGQEIIGQKLMSQKIAGVPDMDIGAERAWDITVGQSNVVVAVVDTGVDFAHPDLRANRWVNELEAKGRRGVDDDGNGFIDDIEGWNFVSNTPNVFDDFGHGTHVAGTIGAVGDNGVGVVGVNWNVKLMAIKFLDSRGSGTLANAIRAIDYSVRMRAPIANHSWGGSFVSVLLEQAVARSEAAGQLFVAAAGNEASDNDVGGFLPASYPQSNILSVAAIDNRGDLADFSNYGRESVDIAAPGQDILSTLPRNRYGFDSGTSMAAPHVSGIAGLLLANDANRNAFALRTIILSSARPLVSLRGRVGEGGLARADYALTGERPPVDPNDPYAWPDRKAIKISTPHPYGNEADESYVVEAPGARQMAVRFGRFETESNFDFVEFFDRSGRSYGRWSGNQSNRYSPVIDGDRLVIRFTSDNTITKYGFDIVEAAFRR